MSITERVIIKADDRTKKAFASIRANLGGLAAGLAGVLGARAIGGFIKSTIDMGDRLQKASIQLGVSTEVLSEFTFVADIAAVSQNELTKGWKQQTQVIFDATKGIGEGKDALIQLGLSAEDLLKLPMEDQFLAIGNAINKVESETVKVALAADIWGARGTKLLQITKQGTEAINEQRKELRELGGVISRDLADKMAEFNDDLVKIKISFQGLAVAFLDSGALDVFNAAIKASTKVVGFFADEFEEFNRAKHQNEFIFISGEITKTANEITGLTKKLQTLDFKEELELDDAIFKLAELRKELSALIERRDLIKNVFEDETPQNNIKAIKNETAALSKVTADYTDILKGMNAELKAMNATQAEAKRVFEETRTPLENYSVDIEKLNNLFQTGHIEADTYARAIGQAKKEFEGVKEEANELKVSLDQITADTITRFSAGIGDAFAGANIGSKEFNKNIKELGQSIRSQLISSLVQVGVQQAIIFGQSLLFGKKQVAQAAVQGPAITAAYAPAAAATSIASFGQSAIIGAAAMAATFALAKNLSSFERGTDSLARTGPIFAHKDEAVVNATENKRFKKIADNIEGGASKTVNFNFFIKTFDARGSAAVVKSLMPQIKRELSTAFSDNFQTVPL